MNSQPLYGKSGKLLQFYCVISGVQRVCILKLYFLLKLLSPVSLNGHTVFKYIKGYAQNLHFLKDTSDFSSRYTAAILKFLGHTCIIRERGGKTLQETWQDIWQRGGAQDVTHTPNPIFNPTELPPLKLSLVGVWHNIKTCRRLQWQVYSLDNSCVNKGKLL